MTFKVTVRNEQGELVNDLYVAANDLMNGQLFSRSTAAGYADVAMLGTCRIGDHVTLLVDDPENRYKGIVMGDALRITAEDQPIDLVVVPFV
jgi:hypothetical protein